ERLRNRPATRWRTLAAGPDGEARVASRAPVGDLDRRPRIGDVDDAQVTATVAHFRVWHREVGEPAGAALLDGELVDAAAAAAGAEKAQLGRVRGVRDVPEREAAGGAAAGGAALNASQEDVTAEVGVVD